MSNDSTISDEVFANVIGRKVLQYCKCQHVLDEAAQDSESAALSALAKIRNILNDETMNDPQCFYRIEAIIDTFYAHGIRTSHHDWG